MAVIVNATPHSIKVKQGDSIVTFPPSEFIARVAMKEVPVSDVEGFNCSTMEPGEVEGLITESRHLIFIVSAMVLEANKKAKNPRKDLIAPNTGSSAVRNEKGHIEYVLGFVK